MLIHKLQAVWQDSSKPFLIRGGHALTLADLSGHSANLHGVKSGDVVALVGDFTPKTIVLLFQLIDLGAVIVPLTEETQNDHDYFFQASGASWLLHAETGRLERIDAAPVNPLVQELRAKGHGGLVLFSTGTTGRPKAILHDLDWFMQRFETPRPSLVTLNFLLFDHIGGLNTLFHALFNRGLVVGLSERTVPAVLQACTAHGVQVLPTTPTFLRLMLLSGLLPEAVPKSLKVITYGTERMDQPTLNALCDLLPWVDFRQTFGMSELGILRVKSEARDSLYMRIGGEGVETKVENGCLYIRSASRMLGYLNAPSPFDEKGWYNTHDLVEQKGDLIKVVGRDTEVINVGGLKFVASEVERVALEFPNVAHVKATARNNPLTGQHVEITLQPTDEQAFEGVDAFLAFMASQLPRHMVPRRVRLGPLAVNHRFKKS